MISHNSLRIFIRDNIPEANELIGDFEFSAEDIVEACQMAVDCWNETPPVVSTYTVDDFPYQYHLKLKVVSILLQMAAFRYDRNNLSYSAGGLSVNDQDKGQLYQAKSHQYAEMFKAFMMTQKLKDNYDQCWGSV